VLHPGNFTPSARGGWYVLRLLLRVVGLVDTEAVLRLYGRIVY
jgi:hypothetical protein